MAEELSLKFGIDSADAVKGVDTVDAGLKKVETTTKEVSTATRALTTDEQAVVAAVAKLEAVGNSPKTLIRATVEASTAAADMRAKYQAAGLPIPPALEASLKKLETTTAATQKRAGQLKEDLDNARKAGAAAAQGAEAMVGSFGSLESVFQQLKASGSNASKSFADTGLKALGVAGAFTAGVEAGKMFDGMLKSIGVDLSNPVGMLGNLAGALGKTGVMGREASQWLNEAGKSASAYGDMLGPLNIKVNESLRIHQLWGQNLGEVEQKMEKLGIAWTDSGRAAEYQKTKVELLNTATVDSVKLGQNLTEVVRNNVDQYQWLQKEVDAGRVNFEKLNKQTQMAILLSQGLAEAQDKQALAAKTMRDGQGKILEDLDKITVAYRAQMAVLKETSATEDQVAKAQRAYALQLKAWGDAHGLSAKQVMELVDKQNLLRPALEKTTTDLNEYFIALKEAKPGSDELAAATEKMWQAVEKLNAEYQKNLELLNRKKQAEQDQVDAQKKQLYTMEIIETKMMEARQQDIDSLEKQIDCYRRLREEMGAGAKGLEDYAALMKSYWESGTMSLVGFNEQIDIAINQLKKLTMLNFGTKFGNDAKKMADALLELRMAVNMGQVKQTPKINLGG